MHSTTASKPLLKDINGNPIYPDDHITARIKTWNGYVTIAKGFVRYIEPTITTYGCGYAIVDDRQGNVFLNALSYTVELVKSPKGEESE